MSDEPRTGPASWVRDLVARSERPVTVRLSVEIDGIEFPVEVGEQGPGYVDTGTLGLTHELESDLIRWQAWWTGHVDSEGCEQIGGTDEEWSRWNREGERLLSRMQQELGPAFRVIRT